MKSSVISKLWMQFLIFAAAFGSAVPALAANEVPQTFTLDGRLFTGGAGSTTPMTENGIQMKIQVLDSSKTCVLYEETQTVNTATTNGYFTVQVGSAAGALKRSGDDPGHSMTQVFQNTAAISATNAGCTSPYTPVAGDKRYFHISVTSPTTHVTDTLSPDMTLDSVPNAVVADTLQGYGKTSFIMVNNNGTTEVLSQANVENIFSFANYPILTALLSGSSSLYVKAGAAGASVPSFATDPSSAPAGSLWYDSGSGALKFSDGSATPKTLGVAGSGISSVTMDPDLTANGVSGGTINTSGTIGLNNTGVAAGTYTKVTVDAKGRVGAGTTLLEADIPNLVTPGKVSGNAINAGTIGGSTAMNTTGNITTTGTVTGAFLSSSVNSTNELRLYSGTNYMTLTASPSLTGTFSLAFPDGDGTNGQYLATNGSGQFVWTTLSSALPSFSGDVSGNYNTTSVDKIKGKPVTTPSASGQMLVYDGTGITPVLMSGDGTMLANGTMTLKNTGTAGTYFKVTTDAQGRVTAGSNPTTLAGFGITDAVRNGGQTGAILAGTSDANAFTFMTNNVNRMLIDSAGHVGIGTPTSTSALQVNGTSGATLKIVDGNQGAGKVLVSDATGNASWTDPAGLEVDTLATVTARGATTSTASSFTGGLTASTLNVTTTASVGTNLTVGGNGVVSGSLGVGTNAPVAKFQVSEGVTNLSTQITDGSVLMSRSVDGAASAGLDFDGSSLLTLKSDGGGAMIAFRTNNSEKMRLTDTGRLGIGTTTPATKLDIYGTTGATLKIVDGNQAAGKILTSDANGVASWASPSSVAVTSVATGAGLTGGTITSTGTISLAPIADATMLANVSGSAAAPTATTLSALIDKTSNTRGSILYRNATSWVALAPSTAGYFLKTGGAGADPSWADSATSITLAGDVSGAAGNNTVDKIKNVAVSAAAPTTTGQVLRYNSSTTKWEPAFLSMFDLRSTVTGAAAFGGVGCLANQTITWTSATDNLACTNISIPASQLQSIAAHTILANPTASAAAPAATTLTALLDDTASNVQGSLLYRNGTNWVTLAPGTAGYILKTGGAGANPSWVDAATTEEDTLATVTARGATTSTVSSFTGGLAIGTTTATAKLTTVGGATFDTSAGGTNGQVLIAANSSVAGKGGLLMTQYTNYSGTTEGFKFYPTGTGTIGSGILHIAQVVNNAPDTVSDLMTITSTGNVSVTNTVDAAKFVSTADISSGGGANYVMSRSDNTKQALFAISKAGVQQFTIGENSGSDNLTFSSFASGKFIFNGGNVGIGSTVPVTKLDVVGTSGATLKIVDGNQGAGKVLVSDANGVASWTNPSGLEVDTLATVTGRGATTSTASTFNGGLYASEVGVGTNNPVRKMEVAGTLAVTGNDASYTTSNWQRALELNHGAAVMWKKGAGDKSWAIGKSNATSAFYIMNSTADDNSAAPNYPFVITSAGAVGIGTIAPSQAVDVVGNIRATAAFVSASGKYTNDENNDYLMVQASDDSLRFFSNDTERMTILANGNVGVGTITPTTRLDILGTSGATLKIVDGNQGAGKVLSSNASGVASWTDPSGLEADTLATVTGRGATTTTASTFNGGLTASSLNMTGDITMANAKAIGSVPNGATPRDMTWDGSGTMIRDTGHIDLISDTNNDAVGNFRFYSGGASRATATLLMTLTAAGKLGIGSGVPVTKLDVIGTSGATLKIVDGNQGAGKILVSDANGVASWTSASSAEADTLASVTGRGATTSTASTFSGGLYASEIGIGTTNPTGLFDILNSTAFMMLRTPGTTAGSQALTGYVSKDDGNLLGATANNRGWQFGARGDAFTGQNDYLFTAYWNGTSWIQPFSITPTGNILLGAGTGFGGKVGIGSSTPVTKLDIIGTSGATLKIVDGNQGAGKVLISDANGVASWSGAVDGTVTSISTGTGLTGGPIADVGTISLAPIADDRILSNISGASAAPTANSLTSIIDSMMGNTQGSILYRNATAWTTLPAGTSGYFLKTQGSAANPVWAAAPAGTVTSIATTGGISGGTITGAGTLSLTAVADNMILANVSGASASPAATTFTSLVDNVAGNAQGSILYRSAGAWTVLAPGTAGYVLKTGGAGANPSWATVASSEADTLATVTGRGATTATASSFTGGLTASALTVTNDATVGGHITTSREGLIGTYNSAQVQNVWSMGAAYTIDTVANDFGTLYGLGYAYSTTGGAPFTGTHQLVIAQNGVINGALGLNGNAFFAGNVGIGTTAPGQKLEVAGNIKATAFISTSDRRLKKDIETSSGLDTIMKLRGVKFRWKSNDVVEYGTIAQEVEEVMPDLVVTDQTTGYKAVKYMGLIAPLIEATKELNNKCDMGAEQLQRLQSAVEQNQRDIGNLKRHLASVEEENARMKELLKAMDGRLKALEQQKQK